MKPNSWRTKLCCIAYVGLALAVLAGSVRAQEQKPEHPRYTVTDLPVSNAYVVTAWKTGYAARAYGEFAPVNGPAAVALGPAERKENLDIKLCPHVLMTGHLNDQDATPFAGALITASRASYQEGRRTNPDYLRQIWEEERGKLFAKLKENGQLGLLDDHIGPDGLDFNITSPLPRKP